MVGSIQWRCLRVVLGLLTAVLLVAGLARAEAVAGTVVSGFGTAAGEAEPGEGGCVTNDECDDDDDCTEDVCAAGQCASTPIEGIDGAWCELDSLYDFCEVTDVKIELLLEKKIERAEILLDKSEYAATSKRQTKALKVLRKVLRRLRAKIVKATQRGRAPDTCIGAIEDALARVDVLVQGLQTRR
jgi:hypothetical protein